MTPSLLPHGPRHGLPEQASERQLVGCAPGHARARDGIPAPAAPPLLGHLWPVRCRDGATLARSPPRATTSGGLPHRRRAASGAARGRGRGRFPAHDPPLACSRTLTQLNPEGPRPAAQQPARAAAQGGAHVAAWRWRKGRDAGAPLPDRTAGGGGTAALRPVRCLPALLLLIGRRGPSACARSAWGRAAARFVGGVGAVQRRRRGCPAGGPRRVPEGLLERWAGARRWHAACGPGACGAQRPCHSWLGRPLCRTARPPPLLAPPLRIQPPPIPPASRAAQAALSKAQCAGA